MRVARASGQLAPAARVDQHRPILVDHVDPSAVDLALRVVLDAAGHVDPVDHAGLVDLVDHAGLAGLVARVGRADHFAVCCLTF